MYSLDDADVYKCFKDLWLIKRQLENLTYQGIESDNITKLRVSAGDAIADANGGKDNAIADVFFYGNKFYVPVDFELLTDHQPFYQAWLADRLSYELTLNNYSKVVSSTDANAKYIISGISLEYEVVTNAELARRMIKNQYSGRMAVLYDRADTMWNINLNNPAICLRFIIIVARVSKIFRHYIVAVLTYRRIRRTRNSRKSHLKLNTFLGVVFDCTHIRL